MRFLASVAVAVVVWMPTLFADAHMVQFAVPRGAGRGETVDVRLYGDFLDDPVEVVFHGPGIRCVALSGPTPVEEPALFQHMKATGCVAARFVIAEDCPLGEHLLRLRTRTLFSEPVTFWVGPFPSVPEAETKRGQNDQPGDAQAVPLNCTVNGRIHPADDLDRDCYAMTLLRGQRFSTALEAVRLGTQHYEGENDCQLRIVGPDGAELVACDDTALLVQDPLAGVVAPADGTYTVEVSQQMHTPGPRCFYRLHLGTFPTPTTAFPAGGRPGETLTLRLLGDAAGPVDAIVTLPDSRGSPGELDRYRFHCDAGGTLAPTPLALRVTPHANVVESPGTASVSGTLPVAFNGVIGHDGETDQWRFLANKGERLDIRVFARSLGTPLDPWIRVRRAEAAPEAKPLAEADDASLADRGFWSCHTRLHPKDVLDPAIAFTAPEAGDYLLEIGDTRGIGGPQHVYRVELSRHVPGLHPFVHGMFARKQPRETAFTVPQGSQWTLPVLLGEGLGTKFPGDVELEAVGLPRGVTMDAPRFTQGLRKMPVQFRAAADAEPGVHFIRLVARAVDGTPLAGSPQQGFTYTDRRGGYAWHNVMVDHFALAIVDPACFRLECSNPAVTLTRNGEVTLDLRIIREPGCDVPLELQADWLPPGVEKGPPVALTAGATAAQLRLRATDKAVAGIWPITVTASTTNGDVLTGLGCRLVTTPFIMLDVSEPFLTVRLPRTAIERGTQGAITATLVHHRKYEGRAAARLVGLPHGVRQIDPTPQVASGDMTCAFQVEVTPDALVGLYKDISVEIAVPEGSRVVRQQSGSGVLRVDPSRGRP